MKKGVFGLIATVMFLLSTGAALAETGAEKPITVKVDNSVIDFPDAKPFIDNGRTMVPVRFVSQALGATVQWDGAAKTVKMNRQGKSISLKIGEKRANVNGKAITFDAAAQLRESRTYVPLRFVSEAYGERVDWFAAERVVQITTVKPNTQIMTQGEYIVGLVKALKLHNSPTQQQAYDLAKKAGILDIQGYQYAPAQPLKRIEVARFALRAIRQWYEVRSKGMTDDRLVVLLKVMKNYPDQKFHGEDFVSKADAHFAINEVHEWKDARDRGKPLYEAFHNSLKVQNGILTGKVPKSPGKNITVQCVIKFKDNRPGLLYENAENFSVKVSDVQAMAFVAYDGNIGTTMADYVYIKLPSLQAVEDKVKK